jgi:hypothetical protein
VPSTGIVKYLENLDVRREKNPFYNADTKFWCRAGTWELHKSRREKERDKAIQRDASGA